MKQILPSGPGECEVDVRTIWSPYGEPMEIPWHDGILKPASADISAYLGVRGFEALRLCCIAIKAASRPSPWGGEGLSWRGVNRIARVHGGGCPPVIGLPLRQQPLAPAKQPVGEIIGRALNRIPSGITDTVYNLWHYQAEKLDALERWGAHLAAVGTATERGDVL